jgi:hypothetical protein
MLAMSPDELQHLVQSAVTSAMNASVKPVASSEASGFVDAHSSAILRSSSVSTPPAAVQGDLPQMLSPQNSLLPLKLNDSATHSPPYSSSIAAIRESRSAIVQTDGDEQPRRAPSPLSQSTRQAINDAYNFSLPQSRHVQVLSVAPGAPVAPALMQNSGSIEAQSVAVMLGQPPVASEVILSPGIISFFTQTSSHHIRQYDQVCDAGKVSRLLLSGHHDGFESSAATLDRSSLARQFSTQPDPVSASQLCFLQFLTVAFPGPARFCILVCL